MKRDPIYGLMAEFDSAQALVDAAHATHQAGYKKIDAYSPFPIEGLAEEIGFHFDEIPLTVLIGGIVGAVNDRLAIRDLWRPMVAGEARPHGEDTVGLLEKMKYHLRRRDDRGVSGQDRF